MSTPNMRPVGPNLRYLRHRRRLSLRRLARLSGVAKSTISDIERDVCRDPGVYTLRDIAKALGVSVETLLTTDLRPGKDGQPVEMVTHHFGEAINE